MFVFVPLPAITTFLFLDYDGYKFEEFVGATQNLIVGMSVNLEICS